MTDTVIDASYVNVKTIPSRSLCRIELDIPIERMAEFIAKFGAPIPGVEVHVALALLNSAAIKPKARTLSQEAHYLTTHKGFWEFINTFNSKWEKSENGANDFIKTFCKIESKSELDNEKNSWPIMNFKQIQAQFKDYQQGIR